MNFITARAGLAATALAAAALAGCNAGRDDQPFVPKTSAAPPVVNGAAPVAPAAPAAPVVSGASADPAKVVKTDAGGASADPAVRRAEHQRKVARREAREAKAHERRAHKRAAAREAALRAKLREARRQEAETAAQQQSGSEVAASKPKPSDSNSIAASDVETQAARDRRADTEARAAVVRYHELLDHHDAAACDMLTARMLESFYGDAGASATQRCRSDVQAITAQVSVEIVRSAASGRNALLDAITHVGDSSVHQGLALVLVDGTWKIDAAKPLED
jgi:hypothetical protein